LVLAEVAENSSTGLLIRVDPLWHSGLRHSFIATFDTEDLQASFIKTLTVHILDE